MFKHIILTRIVVYRNDQFTTRTSRLEKLRAQVKGEFMEGHNLEQPIKKKYQILPTNKKKVESSSLQRM